MEVVRAPNRRTGLRTQPSTGLSALAVSAVLLTGLFVATAVLAHVAPSPRSTAASLTTSAPLDGGRAASLSSPLCEASVSQPGDVDGDDRPDTVEVLGGTDADWLVRVHRGSGELEEARVANECATLLGLADVNSDGRQEIWLKAGVGNTAHAFDLIAWTGESLRVVVGSVVENPLLVGWGLSGGATLWCADATGDGRTDIVRQEFDRKADGSPENEREFVYQLREGELREVFRGPARTPLPGTHSALICGTVSWGTG